MSLNTKARDDDYYCHLLGWERAKETMICGFEIRSQCFEGCLVGQTYSVWGYKKWVQSCALNPLKLWYIVKSEWGLMSKTNNLFSVSLKRISCVIFSDFYDMHYCFLIFIKKKIHTGYVFKLFLIIFANKKDTGKSDLWKIK